tara:strand:- start:2237 stop:2497 length:261 start_codon:yes stop_codon:yes gene_type:complete
MTKQISASGSPAHFERIINNKTLTACIAAHFGNGHSVKAIGAGLRSSAAQRGMRLSRIESEGIVDAIVGGEHDLSHLEAGGLRARI